jgi:hypothetical protein
MLVVDLLHEFELGVWKALFTHLIRVLYAAPGSSLVAELDRRYVNFSAISYWQLITFLAITRFRAMPTFGSGTIRRFATNASEMKKLAARNFEDLLQVTSTISSMKKEKIEI